MSNLVNRVVPRPSRITDATTDKDGARGAKLLNGFFKSPVAGRPTASLPVRAQFTSAARTWQALLFLPREGSPAGDWFARKKQGSVRKPVFIGDFAEDVFSERPSRQHKKAGHGFHKNSHAARAANQVEEPEAGRMVQ